MCHPDQVAQQFNDYFTSIAKEIKTKIRQSKYHFTDYLKEPNLKDFSLRPCTPESLQSIIDGLNSNKSSGPNSIPTAILKLIKESISIPLSKLINYCFDKGIFPQILKEAKVIPVFKSGSREECSNYFTTI